jgi:hypothetical protein
MVQRPIWCTECHKHSWTRKQLYNAWVNDKPIRCPEPTCNRVIPTEEIEALLEELGLVKPDEEAEGR